MSRLLVVAPTASGRLRSVLADEVEVCGGVRAFRRGARTVLRLPADAPVLVRSVVGRAVPEPEWGRLREALRSAAGPQDPRAG